MKALTIGSTGWAVKKVQRKLDTTPDGRYDTGIALAVKKWQREHGLTADGIVGPLTWAKMFPVVSKVIRPADIIVLDIGHGTNNTAPGVFDSGATGGGWQEHDRAERLVDELSVQLKRRGRVVRIVHDIAVTKRDDVAAGFKPFLFVSNHLNSGGGRGVEVLVNRAAGAKARRIARDLASVISVALEVPNRGVKNDVRGLAVLRGMPSKTLLIEWVFIDSATDRKKLATNEKKAVAAAAAVLSKA